MNRSIVINREYGSGGREIGQLICDRTGMDFYDSRILQEAASSRGLPQDLLESFDERVATGQFFDLSLLAADPETAALPYRVYAAIDEVVTGVARVAPAVFIGRCADKILRDAKLRYCSVFVYSTDLERKVARAMRVDGVEHREAERHIARMDKTRARYQQFFTSSRFGDYRHYDLCLNSGRLGYDTCADIIITAASTAGPAPLGQE